MFSPCWSLPGYLSSPRVLSLLVSFRVSELSSCSLLAGLFQGIWALLMSAINLSLPPEEPSMGLSSATRSSLRLYPVYHTTLQYTVLVLYWGLIQGDGELFVVLSLQLCPGTRRAPRPSARAQASAAGSRPAVSTATTTTTAPMATRPPSPASPRGACTAWWVSSWWSPAGHNVTQLSETGWDEVLLDSECKNTI